MTNPLKDNAVPRRSFLKGALVLLAAPLLLPKAVTGPQTFFVSGFDAYGAPVTETIRLAQIREILMPGIREWVSTYEIPPAEWERIFGA
jgi:hypothetical protein